MDEIINWQEMIISTSAINNEIIDWQEIIKSSNQNDFEFKPISIINLLKKEGLTNIPKSLLNTFTEKELKGVDLDVEEVVVIYKDDDLKQESNRSQLTTSECNFCVLFNVETVIKEILHSYLNEINDSKDNIIKQVNLDFPRMSICHNSKACENVDELHELINRFKKYKHSVTNNLYDLLLMLTTQSPFFYPFKIIYDIYSSPDSNIHIIADSDMPTINIINKNNSIDVVFKKTFKHIDVDNRKILNRFHTFMIFTIDLITVPAGYIYPEFNYSDTNFGILHWIKEKSSSEYLEIFQ